MQFSALGKKGGGKKVKRDLPVNKVIRLDHIELGNGVPSFFHGFEIGTNEPIKIRMMTIEEGVKVNMRNGESLEQAQARIQQSYVGTGEKHRPRPAEIASETHKAHCEAGGVMMFSKCLANEDGSFRAHWVETLERRPGAGCDKVFANIRAENIVDNTTKQVTGFSVVADVVNPGAAVVLDKGNLMPTLLGAFANRNGDEMRKPFVFARLVNAETGAVILPGARANAKYDMREEKDADTGQEFKVYEAASAEDSVTNLFNPESTSQDAMMIRAALFGLGEQPGYPEFKDVKNDALLADLKQVTDAVRSGALRVEIIPGERISAGPATRASIEKAVKGNPNHPVNMQYTQRNEKGYVTERRFCDTYLTTKLGKDGHRYFTKAVPAELYPAMQSVVKMATVNDHTATATISKARAAESVATEVEINEDMPLDANSLDTLPGTEVDEKLAASAHALDASIV